MDKDNLRIYAKNIRKSINIEESSKKIVQKIKAHKYFIEAKNVLIFYPLKYELNILDLLAEDKNFYLPRVFGDDLEICPYRKGDELKKSDFSVMEPICESVDANILDLVVVPALMADKDGYRLGYGKGFYDRFLKGKALNTIYVVPKDLYVNSLPNDSFDIKSDVILTD